MPRAAAAAFLQARDFLLENRADYEAACAGFRWPNFESFNWAADYFDEMAAGNSRPALVVTGENSFDQTLSFAELRERSLRVTNFFRKLGIGRGDRILVMLGNEVPLWETMLAALRIGAVVIPTSGLISAEDLTDRMERGAVRHVITNAGCREKFAAFGARYTLLLTGGCAKGWIPFEHAYEQKAEFTRSEATNGRDPFLLYFTSGTTAKPKLVLHSQHSYPVGHLSTMYWIGLQPGDLHWNISSPGWAKHAWSSFFAPWNAEACVVAANYARFDAGRALETIARMDVTTLCGPPTVWRMLIKEDLRQYPMKLREIVSAGEPINPEVIRQVQDAWGLTVRDGYGQTETTAVVGNTPGQTLKPGSMGKVLPGYRIDVRDSQLCVDREHKPLGLMLGYQGQEQDTSSAARYHETGDVVRIDEDGYLFFIGRRDDVFKSSDYRISPFELESIAIECPAVMEAAVVPSPDPVRFAVPKVFVALAPGYGADKNTAREILSFLRDKVAPYKRIRRLEFSELPKTSSGKIRRVELREAERNRTEERRPLEFFDHDFS